MTPRLIERAIMGILGAVLAGLSGWVVDINNTVVAMEAKAEDHRSNDQAIPQIRTDVEVLKAQQKGLEKKVDKVEDKVDQVDGKIDEVLKELRSR